MKRFLRGLARFLLATGLALAVCVVVTLAARALELIPATNISVGIHEPVFRLLYEPGLWAWTYDAALGDDPFHAFGTLGGLAFLSGIRLVPVIIMVAVIFWRFRPDPERSGRQYLTAAILGAVSGFLIWLPVMPIPNTSDGAKLFVSSLDVLIVMGALIWTGALASVQAARSLIPTR